VTATSAEDAVFVWHDSHAEFVSHEPCSEEFWENWEGSLNSMCKEIEACAGATELVHEFSKLDLPMAIATSSQSSAVEKKRLR